MIQLAMAGYTDAGRMRDHNEDCFLVDPDRGIAILADGMGGHLAGEVASAMAVEVIHHALGEPPAPAGGRRRGARANPVNDVMRRAVERANYAIYEASHERPECRGMGTTVVAALVRDGKLHIAHVGDSRLYRLRRGEFTQITEDHSLVQELLRDGLISAEQARVSPNRNLVTRALGVDVAIPVDIKVETVRAGDLYLLCTDGLSDVLAQEEIEEILVSGDGDLASATESLVAAANDGGGPDNITAVLVAVSETRGRRTPARRGRP
jgi:serine/threonine protein phosphatase PrpC